MSVAGVLPAMPEHLIRSQPINKGLPFNPGPILRPWSANRKTGNTNRTSAFSLTKTSPSSHISKSVSSEFSEVQLAKLIPVTKNQGRLIGRLIYRVSIVKFGSVAAVGLRSVERTPASIYKKRGNEHAIACGPVFQGLKVTAHTADQTAHLRGCRWHSERAMRDRT